MYTDQLSCGNILVSSSHSGVMSNPGQSWTPLSAGGSGHKLSTSRAAVKTGIPQKTWWKGENLMPRPLVALNKPLIGCSIMKMGHFRDSEASGTSEG